MNISLKCKKIRFAQASDFYDVYEHLGNPGRGVYHWGAFDRQLLVGAVSFGGACFALHRGIFAQIADKYELRVYQLTRGGTAPLAPRNTGSWIVSQGLKQLKSARGECLVVAYSDPYFNEIGTIYQAANFLFLGKTDPKGQSDYVINGQFMSGWKVRRRFGTRDMTKLKEIDPDFIRMPLRPKYRYLYLATSRIKRKKILAEIDSRIVPYPKRYIEGVGAMKPLELVKQRANKTVQERWAP
ncbi:MAG: hypothetical protein Tsb0027_23750 [Wenzhouxiangellaceae bacterium]